MWVYPSVVFSDFACARSLLEITPIDTSSFAGTTCKPARINRNIFYWMIVSSCKRFFQRSERETMSRDLLPRKTAVLRLLLLNQFLTNIVQVRSEEKQWINGMCRTRRKTRMYLRRRKKNFSYAKRIESFTWKIRWRFFFLPDSIAMTTIQNCRISTVVKTIPKAKVRNTFLGPEIVAEYICSSSSAGELDRHSLNLRNTITLTQKQFQQAKASQRLLWPCAQGSDPRHPMNTRFCHSIYGNVENSVEGFTTGTDFRSPLNNPACWRLSTL